MPVDKDVLTTGEVAKLCNVAPRTVSKWFDSGQLKGYRIPGSRDRRIPISELHRFMHAHGIPMEGIPSGTVSVLVVDADPEVVDILQRVLTEKTEYEVRAATNGFAAGLECERFKPGVVLLDAHLGDTPPTEIARTVRTSDNLAPTRLIAMSGKLTDGQAQSLLTGGFDAFLRKPFQVRQVVDAIERVTNIVH